MSERLLLSLATGIGIGAAAGYLGSLMLSRRMALVAGPLGHLTLPGVALALLYGFDVSLGAFPFVVLGILLIWAFELRTRLPMEALTAIVFSSSVAAAFLFLPIAQAEAALVGDIARVGRGDTLASVAASLLVVLGARALYPRLALVNISEELAASEGVDVRRTNLLYLCLIAVIVTLGVKVVGGLLTAALVAIPPAVARNLTRTMRAYALVSLAVGATSATLGVLAHALSGQPAGPLIILINAALFLGSLALARR
ncbi:MAG: metal ABC transporter permease [Planctomycetota bacterium]